MPEQFPSVPPPDAEHREPLAQARYKFIYSWHTPENMGEISDHLEDVDVIAFEPFHADDEAERTAIEDVMNRAFASDATDTDKQAAFDTLTDHENGFLPIMLLERFAGSGKRFALIDITTAYPTYESLTAVYYETYEDIRRSIKANRTNEAIKHMIGRHVQAASDYIRTREDIMTDRLQRLGQESPGEDIGVVVGAIHTPVGDAIGQNASVSAVWAAGHANPRLTYEDEAVRAMVANPSIKPDSQALDKILFQEYFSHFGVPKNLGVQFANSIDTRSIQSDLIDAMSTEEITAVLADLEAIRLEYDWQALKVDSTRDELHDKLNVHLNQLLQEHLPPT